MRCPSNSRLVQDVNAETNVVIALVCSADGGLPKATCMRPVIRTLLKHVK